MRPWGRASRGLGARRKGRLSEEADWVFTWLYVRQWYAGERERGWWLCRVRAMAEETTLSKRPGAQGGAQAQAAQAARRVLEARRGQGRALPVVERGSKGERVGQVLAYVLEVCREDQWGDLIELMHYG